MSKSHRIIPWTAPHTVRWYGPGEHCTDPVPGDLILVSHGTGIGRAITIGEWVLAHLTEPELKSFTWLDHVALIRERRENDPVRGNGEFVVSEMGPAGHEYRLLNEYQAHLYAVVHFDVDDDARQTVLDADDRCGFITYGWLQYPALFVGGLTGMKAGFSLGTAMICSTEVTMCAQNVYLFPDRPAAAVTPAHIACWVGAVPPNN